MSALAEINQISLLNKQREIQRKEEKKLSEKNNKKKLQKENSELSKKEYLDSTKKNYINILHSEGKIDNVFNSIIESIEQDDVTINHIINNWGDGSSYSLLYHDIRNGKTWGIPDGSRILDTEFDWMRAFYILDELSKSKKQYTIQKGKFKGFIVATRTNPFRNSTNNYKTFNYDYITLYKPFNLCGIGKFFTKK